MGGAAGGAAGVGAGACATRFGGFGACASRARRLSRSIAAAPPSGDDDKALATRATIPPARGHSSVSALSGTPVGSAARAMQWRWSTASVTCSLRHKGRRERSTAWRCPMRRSHSTTRSFISRTRPEISRCSSTDS